MDVIFFLRFEVEPLVGSANWEECGGGQFNCWIRADNIEAARKRALEVIESDSWVPLREEESLEVPDDHYEPEAPGLTYYDEAQRDGEAFVVHTWPPDGDEEQAIN